MLWNTFEKDFDKLDRLHNPNYEPDSGLTDFDEIQESLHAMRKELDLFANMRPVKVPSEGIDWMFFRENTEGEYALGSSGIFMPSEISIMASLTSAGNARNSRSWAALAL